MKIVSMHSENVMRLRVVDITPGDTTVVVGGRNAQGKSSVLRSIEMALGGKDAAPRTPVRNGEEVATIRLDLGEVVVTRRMTSDGKSTLAVKSREGATFSSPQAMLDQLVGGLSFDPLAFSRMKPREAADVLCRLVGLDLAGYQTRRQALYEERTAVNRQLKAAEGVLAGSPRYDDAPASQVSVADVSAELAAARQAQKDADAAEHESKTAARRVAIRDEAIEECRAEIAELRERLSRLEPHLAREVDSRPALVDAATKASDEASRLASLVPDSDAIAARLQEIEVINGKVRANRVHEERVQAAAQERTKSEALTAAIEAVDAEKVAAVCGAAFPVPGLSVDDDGVTLNGVPFEQASSAEQLRASVAIGIAMNPKLRVLLVRDGSLLDGDGLKLLADLATEHDAQVWVERVADNADGCTVFIEDGAVLAADAEAAQ